MKGITYIYFSATSTTARCAKAVGEAMGLPINREINIADNHATELPFFESDDIAIIAAPVYAGRLPEHAVKTIRILRGKGAYAVALVVYGNRDYDDALLELTNMLKDSNFNIIGAGAFIGQHSIFPNVGAHRPDKADMKILSKFGEACRERVEAGLPFAQIDVKGNFPYKRPGNVPFHPKCNSKLCNACKDCAKHCPVGAINPKDPTSTDNDKCISCGRCIFICKQYARKYSGLKYILAGKLFEKANSQRKEPEWVVAE